MSVSILVGLFTFLYFFHNVLYLRLFDRVLGVKSSKSRVFVSSLCSGVVGAAFLYGIGSMSALGYGIMLAVYVLVVMLHYPDQSKVTRMVCVLTFNVHIMTVRAAVSAIFSLATGRSILELSQDVYCFWIILIITTIISALLTIGMLAIIPARYFAAITQKAEQLFLYMAIAILANIYLIANGMVYVDALGSFTVTLHPSALPLHQLIVAVVWLLVLYVSMFMLVAFDLLRTHRDDLEKQIDQDAFYKEMMLGHADVTIQLNATQDRLIEILMGDTPLQEMPTVGYAAYLEEMAQTALHPDDAPLVMQNNSLENIRTEFAHGNVHLLCQYRVLQDDQSYRWMRSSILTKQHPQTGELISLITVTDDIHESKLQHLALQADAERDALVPAYNRRTAQALIGKHLQTYKSGVLLLVDLDNFKAVNDNLGHAFGDKVLKDMTAHMLGHFRQEDIVGRIGGDEFLVFLKGRPSLPDLQAKVQALSDMLHNTYSAPDGQNITVSASIGIALAPEHADDFSALYQAADLAMYACKKAGKNDFSIYDRAVHKDYAGPLRTLAPIDPPTPTQ